MFWVCSFAYTSLRDVRNRKCGVLGSHLLPWRLCGVNSLDRIWITKANEIRAHPHRGTQFSMQLNLVEMRVAGPPAVDTP